jgi:hypothetical protein
LQLANNSTPGKRSLEQVSLQYPCVSVTFP